VAAEYTKSEVNYSKGTDAAHCGICEHYRDHACSLVKGEISPDMWCKLFHVQKDRPQGGKDYR
jgi:hypothetical protein